MPTNLEQIHKLKDTFLWHVPRTRLAICVTTEPNISRETFTATLLDLDSDWGVTILKSVSAAVCGERIEKILNQHS
jgi:ERCC4-type nuclease